MYIVVLTTLTMLVEFLRSHRHLYWRGWTWELAAGVLVAAVIYLLAYGITTVVLRRLLTKLPFFAQRTETAGAIAAAVPAVAYWGIYQDLGLAFRGMVLAIHLGAIATILLTRHFKPEASTAMGIAVLTASLTACVAIPSLSFVEFLDPEARIAAVSKTPILWLAGAGAVLAALALLAPKRRGPLAVAVVTACLVWPAYYAWAVAIPSAASTPSTDPDNPNLLIVTIDTLRADYTAPYGGPVPMPALENLASDGALFEQSFSGGPWTLPSMYALFTSRPAPSLTPGLGIDKWIAEIRHYDPTGPTPMLAEVLEERGYTTGAFLSNAIMRNPEGITRGFDQSAIYEHQERERVSLIKFAPFLQDILLPFGGVVIRPVDTTDLIEQIGKTFIERHTGQPWFLWLHIIDPHSPYDPPDRFRTIDGPELWVDTKFVEFNRIDPDVPEEFMEWVVSMYNGEIEYADEALGHILDAVNAKGMGDATLVCVTSDHGEEFKDHGGWLHGRTMFNEMLHVPLVIRGLGVSATRVQDPIGSIDVMPTLAELLGVEPPEEWMGKSWATHLRDASAPAPVRPVVAQGTNRYFPNPQQAIVAEGRKLIRNVGQPIPADQEMYNLLSDPKELTDVAEVEPERTGRLHGLLDEWSKSFDSIIGNFDSGSTAEEEKDIKERLEALGYL